MKTPHPLSWQKAIFYLLQNFPYLGSVLVRIEPRFDDKFPLPFIMDGNLKAYVKSSVWDKLSKMEQVCLILKGVHHFMRQHEDRGKGKVKEIWGKAASLVVERCLEEDLSKSSIPDFVATGLDYKDFSKDFLEESIYNILNKEREKSTEGSKGDSNPDSEESSGSGGGSSNSAMDSDDSNPSSSSSGTGDNSDNSGSSFGSVAGTPESYEEDGEGDGEAPQLSDAQKEAIRESVLAQASVGHQPGSIARLARDLVKPKPVPWNVLLRKSTLAMINKVRGLDDFSMTKAKQKNGIIFPGLIKSEPRVSVLIDTSGSISDKDLSLFISTLAEIKNQGGIEELKVVFWDADYQGEQTFRSPSDFKKLKPKGWGGTDMVKGIKWLKDKHKPDIIICLTDGFCYWPEKLGIKNVIVCLSCPSSISFDVKRIDINS